MSLCTGSRKICLGFFFRGPVRIDQLRIGDLVQCGGESEWDTVIGWYDYKPASKRDFQEIHYGESGRLALKLGCRPPGAKN